jgi:CRP/FNR family nitrogen fixation transcriptional regulator
MQTFTATTGNRIPAAIAMRGAANLPRSTGETMPGTRRAIGRGQEVFSEGDPCASFYKVVSGIVRTVKLLPDGRRQIEAFHLAGDVFGLETGTAHRFSAEAVDDAVVIAHRRSCLADPAVGVQMMSWMQISLDRAQDHMVVLGRKNAVEKLASFLLDLAGRTTRQDRVELPMQRSDIADYLGLTIETVSRTISQMVRRGLIRLLDTHTVLLADKTALQQLGS